MAGDGIQRSKSETQPPRVCPDCYWKRMYLDLEKAHLELRRQLFAQTTARKTYEVKKRGSGTMPTAVTMNEIEDRTDLHTLLDGLERGRR